MARYRGRSSGRAGTTLLAILFMLIVAVGMGGAGYWLWWKSQKPGIDEATLCPETGPVAHLAILVDTTDPLSLTHVNSARQHIEQKIDEARVGTLISFYTVSPDSSTRQSAFFSMCKPASREEANQLYENPRLIEERFQRDFANPVREAMNTLLSVPEANSSPIMESAQEFAAQIAGFTVGQVPRELILMSDLVQHSDVFSFFKGDNWESFSRRGGPARFSSNFNGASVTVLRVPRQTLQTAVIDDFWYRYFDAQGFDRVRVTKIGDL